MGPGRHQASHYGKPKDFKGTLKRLLGYLKPYRVSLGVAILFILLATLFSILSPKVLGMATTELFSGFQRMATGGGIDFEAVGRILIVLGIIYLLSALFNYIQQYMIAGISQKTMYNLRKDVDEKLAKLPLNYFDTRTYGEILSRVTNDVDTVSTSFQQSISQLITSVATVIGILVMMLVISPWLSLIALITLPLSMLASMKVVKRSQGFFKGQQISIGELNGHVEEMYTGHEVIKLYGREKQVTEEFDKINDKLFDNAWKAQFCSSIIMPIIGFVGNLGYILVCVGGGVMVSAGMLPLGDIQAFIQYLRQFNQPISQTANIANIIQSTVAAAERIFEVLDEQEEVPDTDHPVKLTSVKGEVVFENVTFGYDKEHPLIKNLNFSVKPGQKIAIVGPTGAGKTTLVNLLMRFYDVDGGRILIDGVDIMDMTRDDLRDMFGMVLQDTWSFKGTIRENIRYGDLGQNDKNVVKAADAAYADHFIRTLPGGYEMILNEDASNISQGQKQLLTIARAVLSDPSILILDEATSSVDTRTELLIQKAMNKLTEGRTSFVIAHRLSTIRDADCILVLKDGDIIETGSHEELMAQGGFYKTLYNSQFAQPEAG
ncbi:ABC transporter ATP-binding protein [Oscillospiraceae bacterium NSJ-54]|uniref:ABC transporter ATP-binding protein n=2 Tax=Zongyangia hominis TaxID=2763677 RepID=A0A926IAQ3_9FIRM|nr:ABC transporter ATP-binding protein [Zongyangia hominis]